MRAKTFIQILTLFTLSLGHLQSIAQHTATAVMNVTVEVVDGSTVQLNQNELITFNENGPAEIIFATFSISHDQENSILTSASGTIQMMNGIDSVEMISNLKENYLERGQLTLEFSTDTDTDFTGGFYTGKQIAEIVYL